MWNRLHRIQVSPRVRVLVEIFEPGLDATSKLDDLSADARTLASLGRVLRRVISETQEEPK